MLANKLVHAFNKLLSKYNKRMRKFLYFKESHKREQNFARHPEEPDGRTWEETEICECDPLFFRFLRSCFSSESSSAPLLSFICSPFPRSFGRCSSAAASAFRLGFATCWISKADRFGIWILQEPSVSFEFCISFENSFELEIEFLVFAVALFSMWFSSFVLFSDSTWVSEQRGCTRITWERERAPVALLSRFQELHSKYSL